MTFSVSFQKLKGPEGLRWGRKKVVIKNNHGALRLTLGFVIFLSN
jgi:hypothetical protein